MGHALSGPPQQSAVGGADYTQQPQPQPNSGYATPDTSPSVVGAGQSASQPTQAKQPSSNTMASPFGTMNFGNNQPQAMAHGGVVTKPTLAILGEHGAEAVVPMSGNPNARITPDMIAPRNDIQTGPSSLIHPLHGLKPTSGPLAHKPSGWKRWDAAHPQA